MSETRAEKKAATRLRLRAAAREVFTEVGVERATIGAITRRAGTAHGTFYVHFEDKDTLLGELVAALNRDLVTALQPVWIAHGTDDLGGLLRVTAELFLDCWFEHRDLVGVATRHLTAQLPLESLRDGFNPQAVDLITPWLTRLAEGGHRLPSVRLIGPALLAMWARVGLQYLFVSDVTREEAVETLVALTSGALRGTR
jgi:AcrR family transcriptional regulator